MKILQVIPNIGAGGAERFLVDLSNELSLSEDVSLLTLYSPSEKEVFRRDLNLRVANYSLNKKRGFEASLFLRLYKAILEINPDIIHNHLRSLNYLIPLKPFLKGIPIVHTIHNDAFMECPSVIQRKIRKFFYQKKGVYPITISNESKNSFDKAYIDTDSHLIINGRNNVTTSNNIFKVIDEVEKYKKSSDDRVFVHLGRFEPQKNQIMLVNAFKRLISDGDVNAILILIGGCRDSPVSNEIRNRLKKMIIDCPRILILGEKANATDYLYAADYFCLSSIFEGMPISLIEAFATGCVPICTPVGAIPEMINELDRSLLPIGTSEEDYLEMLKNAYGLSKEQRTVIKLKAQNLFLSKYSMVQCAASYKQLYYNIVKKEM